MLYFVHFVLSMVQRVRRANERAFFIRAFYRGLLLFCHGTRVSVFYHGFRTVLSTKRVQLGHVTA